MLILLEVSQLRDVFRELGEVEEGPHLGVEAEFYPEVVVVAAAVVVLDPEVEAGVVEVRHPEVMAVVEVLHPEVMEAAVALEVGVMLILLQLTKQEVKNISYML